jgi:hypothetical protein
MVAARTALYRGCSARHVAHRRRRNQSRNSGRGCNGEHNRPKTFAKNSRRKRASRGPATEEFPDSGHAATSNPCTEQRHPADPWRRKTADPSMASEAAPALANSAADSCPRHRGRLPSRAREDSRGSQCGQGGINPCGFLSRPDALEPKSWHRHYSACASNRAALEVQARSCPFRRLIRSQLSPSLIRRRKSCASISTFRAISGS